MAGHADSTALKSRMLLRWGLLNRVLTVWIIIPGTWYIVAYHVAWYWFVSAQSLRPITAHAARDVRGLLPQPGEQELLQVQRLRREHPDAHERRQCRQAQVRVIVLLFLPRHKVISFSGFVFWFPFLIPFLVCSSNSLFWFPFSKSLFWCPFFVSFSFWFPFLVYVLDFRFRFSFFWFPLFFSGHWCWR